MKLISGILTAAILVTSVLSQARGVDSSGGSNPFVEAVKTLPSLGLVFAATENALVRQGYVVTGEVQILRTPTDRTGLDRFEITESLIVANCANCQPLKIRVIGHQMNTPPAAGQADIFQVDSVFAK